MQFSSLVFLFIFFPIFCFFYYINKNIKYRNIILLLFSLLFYGYGEPIYIFLMIFSIIFNYFMAILIAKKEKQSKLILIVSIIFNISLLVLFKYTNFLLDGLESLTNISITRPNITLPIGISFYTFQILSYVIDVYWKKIKVQKNILNLGCYITCFPQLIAGPIVKYSTIEKEINDRTVTIDDISDGIRLFIRGLFKKVVFSNALCYIADSILIFDNGTYGFIGALIAVAAYTLHIYYDFSGYSDMAIGIGRMVGFHFDINFNYPYISKSITEFWRRWHISLSTWFKEYIYIPLGGNRVKTKRFILNILIVWLLTGLWHGASLNFVIWGLYYGILLLIEKLFLDKLLSKIPNILKHIYVMIIVGIGWAIFRSTNFNDLKDLLSSLIGLNGIGNIKLLTYNQVLSINYIIIFILSIIFQGPIFNKINDKIQTKKHGKIIMDTCLLFMFIISIIKLVSSSYNPFIYFRF